MTDPATANAPAGPPWPTLTAHRAWLDAELRRLLAFPQHGEHPLGGFAWLDDAGRGDPSKPVFTWITARMTHVAVLAHLHGVAGYGPWIDQGVQALGSTLRDDRHGGWHPARDVAGEPAAGKTAYDHAFVVLAAASASAANCPGADELLQDVLAVVDQRFWDADAGRCVEAWDRAFTEPEDYRGANSNMHMVECFLAAGDVTGDAGWHQRALAIADALINHIARAHRWRLVEHFDVDWQPVLEHHADQPDHPFRPYGTTVGHWLEWARLLVHLEESIDHAPAWLAEAAKALFDAAVAAGWAADGHDGFVYTLDWHDQPVVTARLHWVVAEAIGAAATLSQRFSDSRYEAWYRTFWDHAAQRFFDRQRGSWHHELTADGTPASGVWPGKPDLYHAVQATLLPRATLTPALAPQLARADSARTGRGR